MLFSVVPRAQPDLPAGRAVARRILALTPPAGTTLHLAGLSAGVDGFIHAVYSRFPWVVVFVLGVTYLVLLLLLRSVLLPLKAVVVNTLSILASYGALVFIFQYGHLHSLLGFQTQGYVDATLPVIMFCTIFGVSMDYEVFLLTRIREAWLQTGDNRVSVGAGLDAHGQHHHERGADHRHRGGLVRAHLGSRHQGRGRWPGGGRRRGRHHHPGAACARRHAPAGPLELVDPALAGAGAAAHRVAASGAGGEKSRPTGAAPGRMPS